MYRMDRLNFGLRDMLLSERNLGDAQKQLDGAPAGVMHPAPHQPTLPVCGISSPLSTVQASRISHTIQSWLYCWLETYPIIIQSSTAPSPDAYPKAYEPGLLRKFKGIWVLGTTPLEGNPKSHANNQARLDCAYTVTAPRSHGSITRSSRTRPKKLIGFFFAAIHYCVPYFSRPHHIHV